MNGNKKLAHSLIGRYICKTVIIILALSTFCIMANTGGEVAAGTKIAVIAIDPNLGDIPFYLNSRRIRNEFEWYRRNGYRLASRPGTVVGITEVLLHPDVKAITFVGHGGTRRGDGTIASTLAGLSAKNWRLRMQRELANRYQRTGMPPSQAQARAQKEAQNFNLDRVVNYSCWSLADTSIAEQFVAPGGIYYGSSVRYSGNPLSFVHFWFTGKAQFLLEAYQLPPAPQRRRVVGPTPVPPPQFPPAKNLNNARNLFATAQRQTQNLLRHFGPNDQRVKDSKAEEDFYRREIQRLTIR